MLLDVLTDGELEGVAVGVAEQRQITGRRGQFAGAVVQDSLLAGSSRQGVEFGARRARDPEVCERPRPGEATGEASPPAPAPRTFDEHDDEGTRRIADPRHPRVLGVSALVDDAHPRVAPVKRQTAIELADLVGDVGEALICHHTLIGRAPPPVYQESGRESRGRRLRGSAAGSRRAWFPGKTPAS